MEKVRTADVAAEEAYKAELKEWENAEIKTVDTGPRQGEEYRVKKGTVQRINKPERTFPPLEYRTVIAVEGMWQDCRTTNILLTKLIKTLEGKKCQKE